MTWSSLLLFLAGSFSSVKLWQLNRSRYRLKFTGLLAAALLFSLLEGAILMGPLLPAPLLAGIVEWGHISSLALVLSSLALFVRESKPVFARFPLAYTGLPLLIILSYFLVRDTYALKEWLIAIYQGGAVAVTLLMYSVYAYRRDGYGGVLGGAALFALSWSVYWFLPLAGEITDWAWQLPLAAAIVVMVLGYERIENRERG